MVLYSHLLMILINDTEALGEGSCLLKLFW